MPLLFGMVCAIIWARLVHLMDLYDGVGDGHEAGIYIKNSGRVWEGIQAYNPEHRIPLQQEQTGSH